METKIIFYIVSLVILGAALFSVITSKVLHAAVFLLFSLLGIAGIYFMLDYEFIAAVQISVYVGGIVVLVIFSVFLTQEAGEHMQLPKIGRALATAGILVITGWYLIKTIAGFSFKNSKGITIAPTMKTIGSQLLDTNKFGFIIPFEGVSFLLLAALIGCIVIALKPTKKI